MKIITQDMSRLVTMRFREQVEIREVLGGGFHIMIRNSSDEWIYVGSFVRRESAEKCLSSLRSEFDSDNSFFAIFPDPDSIEEHAKELSDTGERIC